MNVDAQAGDIRSAVERGLIQPICEAGGPVDVEGNDGVGQFESCCVGDAVEAAHGRNGYSCRGDLDGGVCIGVADDGGVDTIKDGDIGNLYGRSRGLELKVSRGEAGEGSAVKNHLFIGPEIQDRIGPNLRCMGKNIRVSRDPGDPAEKDCIPREPLKSTTVDTPIMRIEDELVSAPDPPTRLSCPPPPSSVSFPEPAVMTLSAALPMTELLPLPRITFAINERGSLLYM